MTEIIDRYLTVTGSSESQFTEQRSRFISYAFHVSNVDEVKEHVAALQKEYYDARHVCYAYMLGAERLEWRANDNGEPSGTAGKPILGQINSNNLTDILIVVIRYFGGVKLGTSGLIEAYRKAAADAISVAHIEERYVETDITVLFSYPMMNEVMRVVKDMNPVVVSQEYGEFTDSSCEDGCKFDCRMVLRSRLSDAGAITERLRKTCEALKNPGIIVCG